MELEGRTNSGEEVGEADVKHLTTTGEQAMDEMTPTSPERPLRDAENRIAALEHDSNLRQQQADSYETLYRQLQEHSQSLQTRLEALEARAAELSALGSIRLERKLRRMLNRSK